jgi:Trk-type K+ transport system membrane component
MVAAVMPRSSGFDLSWMPGVSDATKVFLSIVMFIGGGSTSTAGGIRVTTFAVILLTCRAAFTGRHDVNAFHRRIHSQAVMTAVAVTTSCLALVTIVSMTLMAITGCSLSNALFDTCSAFGLGGYSVGVASASSPAVLYILAATMFIGRLGPLTIAYAISRPRNVEPVRYPTEQIVVG